MEISYLNKEIALVRAIDCNDDEPVDMDAIISAMASATNEKRRIDLIRMIPFRFGEELMCLNCGDENLADLGIGGKEDARVKTTLNQWFPAIQYLGLELVENGAPGKLERRQKNSDSFDVCRAKVELEGNYHLIQRSEFDTLAHNVRLLLSMAAFFNRAEGATSPLTVIGEDDDSFLVDTGLLVNEYAQKCPLQANLGEMSDSLIKTAKKLKYSLKRHITTPEGTYGYYTRIGTSFQTIGTAFRSIGTVILPSSAHPQDIDFKGPTAIESNRALSATRYSSFQRVCRISLSR